MIIPKSLSFQTSGRKFLPTPFHWLAKARHWAHYLGARSTQSFDRWRHMQWYRQRRNFKIGGSLSNRDQWKWRIANTRGRGTQKERIQVH